MEDYNQYNEMNLFTDLPQKMNIIEASLRKDDKPWARKDGESRIVTACISSYSESSACNRIHETWNIRPIYETWNILLISNFSIVLWVSKISILDFSLVLLVSKMVG